MITFSNRCPPSTEVCLLACPPFIGLPGVWCVRGRSFEKCSLGGVANLYVKSAGHPLVGFLLHGPRVSLHQVKYLAAVRDHMYGLIKAVHAAVQPRLDDGGHVHSRECGHSKRKEKISVLINVLS